MDITIENSISLQHHEDEINMSPPSEIKEEPQEEAGTSLPEKSKEKYISCYQKFMKWWEKRNTDSFSEEILLAYFHAQSKQLKPSTLWATYSMLRSTLSLNNNINISEYDKLLAFLKKQASGFKSKKSKVLTATQVMTFLKEAPDCIYLHIKVALIFGICGACRREELCNVRVEDIEHHGQLILVNVPTTSTNIQRSFTIDGDFYKYVLKYEALRPQNANTNRFFLSYSNGKCSNRPIGINKFGHMPQEIATCLNLPEPESFTGHSFRRTSATLLADSGAKIKTLKRHGGWKSTLAAETLENSNQDKNIMDHQIPEKVTAATSKEQQPSEPPPKVIKTEFPTTAPETSEQPQCKSQTKKSDFEVLTENEKLNEVINLFINNREDRTIHFNMTINNSKISFNTINK